MAPIFISYRRDDGISTAQLLQMHLAKMFGEDAVFLDTNTIEPGQEFPAILSSGVNNAKIIIVMIGKNWKGTDPQRNRLENEHDWVRKELEIALADKNKIIFPVFVHDATAAVAFSNLPVSLARLALLHGLAIREKEFRRDIIPLLDLVEPYLNIANPLKDLPLDNEKYIFPAGSPFKGLDYFTAADARIFFGRGAEIRKLYNKVLSRKLLFLFGQSGSGKSSLLFAGLTPRMEYKGWTTNYFRRESGINLGKVLDRHLKCIVNFQKQLVILDQAEEIFTNPADEFSPDEEALQLLSAVKHAIDRGVCVIVSFRKEYLAELKKLFAGVTIEDFYLEPLNLNGALEAIRGITNSEDARDNYELAFSSGDVVTAIAQSVLNDQASHTAPLLQVILRKMWDKVENNKPRVFTRELLEEVKSNSLAAFIVDQISVIRKKFSAAADSGLVLDILYSFTTPRGTSASHTREELESNYGNTDLMQVVNELKNRYLLTELATTGVDSDMLRLAHDSLAPLIREQYSDSNLPGQRCSRLLDSKRGDIDLHYEVEFSKTDIAIIDDGRAGMRKITQQEQNVIEKSKRNIRERDLELEQKNEHLEIALIKAQEQTLQAKALALAATAREKLQSDPTISLRLAEAACKMTSIPNKEAQSAFLDVLRRPHEFYLKSLGGHTGYVASVAISPDGKYLLTGSDDKTAKLWNSDGVLLQTFAGHGNEISSVVFSPDGKYILTGSRDKTAKLWMMDGTEQQTFKGHTAGVLSVAISPDGKHILSGSNDKTAKLWNLDGKLLQTFEGHESSVSSVAISVDGRHILTTGDLKTAKLWSVDGKHQLTFEAHTGYVNSVAFSPDGKYILTAGQDNTAKLWKLEGKLQQIFEGHSGHISSACFTADGKYVVTGSDDKTARLWSLNGQQKYVFEGHTHWVTSVAASADGKYILTGSVDKTAKLWKIDWNHQQTFSGHSEGLTEVAVSTGGKYLLSGSRDKTAILWDMQGKLVSGFVGHTGRVNSVAFSADGKHVLTGSYDKTAKLWTLYGREQQTLTGHTDGITSVSFSPDCRFILTASRDETARLWNIDGSLSQIFEGHSDGVTSIKMSPNGKYILTGSFDETAKLWNLNGVQQQTFKGHDDTITSVAFSPDGQYILTGSYDTTAKLWNIDGTLLRTFKGHTQRVTSVTFTADGKYLLTGSLDKTAILWNVEGKQQQAFDGNSNQVTSLAISGDGKYIFTGTRGNKLTRWPLFWHTIDPNNTCVLDPAQMAEYNIPEDMEWGKIW